ncbi:MAG: antibiotic biosynthesis monooxygenase [Acidimicrobiales bacterium]
MSKVSLIAKLPLKADKKDEFVEKFGGMIEAVNDEAGTEIYILNFEQANENVAWVYELYTDAEAMTVHSSSDAMAALIGSLGDVLDGAPDMIVLTPHSGKGL